MENNKNIICYLSEKGHNNFIYPTKTTAVLADGCEYEKLNYLSGTNRKLVAVKVKNECLYPVKIHQEQT